MVIKDEMGEEPSLETGIDIYPLLCIKYLLCTKYIANNNLLYNTGNSA